MNNQEDFLDSINYEQKLTEFDKVYNDLQRSWENAKRYEGSAVDMGFTDEFYRLSEEVLIKLEAPKKLFLVFFLIVAYYFGAG